MAINTTLDIARRAIMNNLEAIDITSKNISNVNNEGYKRRRVDVSQLLGLIKNSSSLTKERAVRVYNKFVENQLRREQQSFYKYDTINTVLDNVEKILGETGSTYGLTYVMNQFWEAWNDLANDPESMAARTVVYERGKMLTTSFNRLFNDLLDKQEEISYEINEKISQANLLIRQIYELNQKIMGNQSNDLLDQRDYLLNNLSELIDVEVRELENNKVVVSLGGQILLSENYMSQINTVVTYNNGFSYYAFYLDKGKAPLKIEGGKVGGLLVVNNDYIPEYVNKINLIAATLANRVNSIHSQGYNLDGKTGIYFFNPNVAGAGDIAINTDIELDNSLIAASANRNLGDGSIALAIAGIQNERIIENDTLENYYNGLVSKIGSQVQEAEFMTKNQENVVSKLKNQRDSISGVSLDEEIVNLIQFEQSYQAAARILKTANDVIAILFDAIR